jgi:hypothetical protein
LYSNFQKYFPARQTRKEFADLCFLKNTNTSAHSASPLRLCVKNSNPPNSQRICQHALPQKHKHFCALCVSSAAVREKLQSAYLAKNLPTSASLREKLQPTHQLIS